MTAQKVVIQMVWTEQDHQAAIQAARNGQANKQQQEGLRKAAQQAGSRGREAADALRGGKPR